MVPSPALLARGGYQKEEALRAGWPRLAVVDRRSSDPHEGVLSRVALDAAHRALASDQPVAVVAILQRLGSGRLLACSNCGELARCAVCAQAEEEDGDVLTCSSRHEARARFCRSCGSTKLKRLRVGVTTLARDIAAQLAQPVSEVTAATDPRSEFERVVVGTEAVWSRVRRSALVVFVDFDQYLLAPRSSARRAAITAVGKAGRLVGSRQDDRGLVVLQTRRGDDTVVNALRNVDFDQIVDEDVATAELLGLTPYGASAEVTGDGAAAFVAELAGSLVSVHSKVSGFEIRASDHATLSAALRAARRPNEKMRVAVE